MAEDMPGSVLCYPPSGQQLDFVRAALPALAEDAPAQQTTLLHAWSVEQPPSFESEHYDGRTDVSHLSLTLQRCAAEDGSPAGPAAPVLRLPADAWEHPAALRTCVRPERAHLTVNGRRFLTPQRALFRLSPFCLHCAWGRVGSEVSSVLTPELASSPQTLDPEEAAEELWAAVAANAAEHGQPPEEALLLLLVLNAASLAGQTGDLGHLPAWRAYVPPSLSEYAESELPRAEQHALALLCCTAMQAIQLACGENGSPIPPWDSTAGRLRVATLQALELRPELRPAAQQPTGAHDLLPALIRCWALPFAPMRMASAWQRAPLPRAALRALGAGMAYARPSETPEELCCTGLELAEAALQDLPQAAGSFVLYGGELACFAAPGTAPQFDAPPPAEPADMKAGAAAERQARACPAADEAWRALPWRALADVGAAARWMLSSLASERVCGTKTKATLDFLAEACEERACLQAAQSPTSSASTCITAQVSGRQAGSSAAEAAGGSSSAGPISFFSAQQRGGGAVCTVPGSSAERHPTLNPKSNPNWPPQRTAAAVRLLACVAHCLQALPRAYLQHGLNLPDPGPDAHSAARQLERLAADRRLELWAPDAPAPTAGASPAKPPAGASPAKPPAGAAPAPGEPAAAEQATLVPPSAGVTPLAAPCEAACCRASVAVALKQAVALLEALLVDPAWLPSGQATLLGALLAPLLLGNNLLSVSVQLSSALLRVLQRLADTGTHVWGGVRAGLAACGHGCVLDVPYALMLTSLRAAALNQLPKAPQGTLPSMRLLQLTLETLQLVLAELGHLEGDEAAWSGMQWAAGQPDSQANALHAVFAYLWRAVESTVRWHQHTAQAGDDMPREAQRVGHMAIRALSSRVLQLPGGQVPAPTAEGVQVLMSYLAMLLKMEDSALPAESLDNALALLVALTKDEDVVNAVVAAQGVPRLLFTLGRTINARAACAASQSLLALCMLGPDGTLDTLMDCRGIQALVQHMLLPAASYILPETCVTRPKAEQKHMQLRSWLVRLRSGCTVLHALLRMDTDLSFSVSCLFWNALCQTEQLRNVLTQLAVARKAGLSVDAEAKALFNEISFAGTTMIACSKLAKRDSLDIVSAFVAAGFPEHVLREVDASDPEMRSASEHSFRILAVDRTTRACTTCSYETYFMKAYDEACAEQEERQAAAHQAADAAMQALLQDEEQVRQRRARAAANRKRRKKGAAAIVRSASALVATASLDATTSAPSHGGCAVAPSMAPADDASTGSLSAAGPVSTVTMEGTADNGLPEAKGQLQRESCKPRFPVPSGIERPAPCAAAAGHNAPAVPSEYGRAARVPAAAAGAAAAAEGACGAPAAEEDEDPDALDMQELLRALLTSPPRLPPGPLLSRPAAQLQCSLPLEVHAAPASASEGARASPPAAPPAHSHLGACQTSQAVDWGPPELRPPGLHTTSQPALGSLLHLSAQAQAPLAEHGVSSNRPGGRGSCDGWQPGGGGAADSHRPTGSGETPAGAAGSGSEPRLPDDLEELMCCPIAQEVMVDPVICADGHTYERAAVERWLARSATSPLTRQALAHTDLTPNHALRNMIQSLRKMQC